MLSLFGCQDLHEINALKVVSTTLANGIAFVLFVLNGGGGVALLSFSHGDVRHWGLQFSAVREDDSAEGIARDGGGGSGWGWRLGSFGSSE